MKRIPHMLLVLFLAGVLSSCSTSEADPTPTAAPETPSPPTVTPGGQTVGDLLDMVASEWPTVTSMETTFWTQEDGVIGSVPDGVEVTVESVMPLSRRHVIRSVNGVVVEEQMAVDGRIYMRGQIVVAAIAPMVGPDEWVEVDPAAASSTSAIAAQVSWLLSPVQSPFAIVSADTRALEAFPGDEIEIGGRTCRTWTFGDVEGISQELALDGHNLPCRLVQRAGGFANVTLYVANVAGLSIEAPEVATPSPAG